MKKIVKRIAAMGAAVMMMASMSAIGVNAYGTASFSNELAHSAYGVWATSISSVSGYSKGTPRFKVKTGGYSDYVDVYNTNQLYSFDSSMCRGNKTYYGYVKNKTSGCKCKVSGEFRFM